MIFKPIPPIFFASFIDDISVSKLINSISQKGHEKSGNRKNIQSRAQEAAVAVAAASGSPSLGAAGKGPQLCPSRGSGSRRASRQDRALPLKGLGQPHGEIMRPEAAPLLRGGKEQSRKCGQRPLPCWRLPRAGRGLPLLFVFVCGFHVSHRARSADIIRVAY